jgi:hypothetical protein
MLSSIYCIALVLAVCASSLLVAFYPLFLNEQSWPFRQTMLGENGYSICVGLIGMVLLCIAITDILQRCSRRLRDWGNAGRGTYPILMALAHAVRFRQLKPGDPFEPAAFFRDLAFKGRPLLFGTTGLSLVAAGVLFAHDTADVTTFADDGITYTQYWSGEKTRIGYADIAHAETQCNFFKKNGGVEVRYVIVAKNGLIFELAKNASIRKTLDSIEHIDRHLVSAGVPFEHEPLRPGIGVPRPPFDPDCLDGLDERFGSDRAVRIRALLHMD